MKIDYRYLRKYYEQMALEQITDEYRRLGYSVSRECLLDGSRLRADLLADNGKEKIVVEVKTGKMNAESKKRLGELADYVNSLDGYKFRVAIVTPPRNREIFVEGLEEALCEEMERELPDDLDTLATHVRVEDVADVDVQTLTVQGNRLDCKGTGVVAVELQYGSDGDQDRDDGWKDTASFAFTFDVSLVVGDERIDEMEINEISVDTSDF